MKEPAESLLKHIHYKALICTYICVNDMWVLEGPDERNGVQIPPEPKQAFIACPAAGHKVMEPLF
jgi:hypothetical protein